MSHIIQPEQTETYGVNDLIRVAKREKNGIRPYLFVNPLQGKHIPVQPEKTMELCSHLGKVIHKHFPEERLLAIGFAETATAIGAAASMFAQNVRFLTQTTREEREGSEYVYFTESHSHAASQGLIVEGFEKTLVETDRILFIEDEVTTGNTIEKLINELRKRFPGHTLNFAILSIVNSMTEERLAYWQESGIPILYLLKIPHEYQAEQIEHYQYHPEEETKEGDEQLIRLFEYQFHGYRDPRFLLEKEGYIFICEKLYTAIMSAGLVAPDEREILVLGTEECMFPGLYFAWRLALEYPDKKIRFHATTRSPIQVSLDAGYPLQKRFPLSSLYASSRHTYVYNLTHYDAAFVLTDAPPKAMGAEAFAGPDADLSLEKQAAFRMPSKGQVSLMRALGSQSVSKVSFLYL